MRLQLAINVRDLAAATDFYSRLFGVGPAKVKPGYANWEVVDPPLKFVVFESADAEPGSINHLGVETDTADQVTAAERRLRDAGLATTGVDDTICCFAEKTETWVTGPDGERWEWYTKRADHDTDLVGDMAGSSGIESTPQPCCS